MTLNRTCNSCGWVHFGVTREFAEAEVAKFNAYFDTLTEEKREACYGNIKSHIKNYEHCMVCGEPYTNFRDGVEGDCPYGCTLNPIIT
jgi:hypothetical protein